MTLNEMRLHLTHRIKHHPDDDEQARPAEKLGCNLRHMQSLTEQTWQHRDQREENRAGKGQACHGEIKKIRSWFTWSYAWDIAAVFLQIIRNLGRLELSRDPEITEEENHRRQQNVMRPAARHQVSDLPRDTTIFEGEANNRCWKQQKRPGENDRHDASVIHLQRHEGRLAAVHLAANHALGVLHRNFAHSLGDGDDRGDYQKQKCHHQNKNGRIDLARTSLAGWDEGLPRLSQCRG